MHGHTLIFEELDFIVMWLINKEPVNKQLKLVLDKLNLDTSQELDVLRANVQLLLCEACLNCNKLMPGVDQLILHLYRSGIPMAIASDSNQLIYNKLTANLIDYFEHYFTHYVCGAEDPEVICNKPDPQVYHVCAQRFPTPPNSLDNVLIIEDSLRGISGAIESGMKTLLVNDGLHSNLSSVTTRVTCIVASLVNFKPESVGLPAYYN